jgi:hypothetical protein
MTAQTPAYLKSRFENGDIPAASDYEDVFDSFVNVATSSIQTLVGGLVSTNFIQVSELNASLVSAASVNASFVSAQTVNASFISCGTVSAATVSAGSLYATNAIFITASANALNADTVSAGNVYIVSAAFYGSIDVSAVATTQAGALLVDRPTAFVIFADGNNNSIRLPTSTRGRVQNIVNATTTVLKIFPAVSGRFLVTAVNASLSIQADRCATIFHQGNDRYGIQIG